MRNQLQPCPSGPTLKPDNGPYVRSPWKPQLTMRLRGDLKVLDGEQVYAIRELDGISGDWVMAVYAFCPRQTAYSCYLKLPENLGTGMYDLRGESGLRAGCFLGRRSHFSTVYGGRGELTLTRRDEHWLEGYFAFSAGRLCPPYDLISIREGYFCAPVR